ncbi:MAG: bifunctional 4-hydroxy-2-oxoglutarate aldolase/2-dehydro-3-deoxy-phosphogluconate aldolase [Chloroflexota bacterium]|nr:bifunctional 4-hydroxy-2-oxoglutarate aldolase/2-dehydro-3-deoxy-phosphogluconate aldolase [Chloroflexota bacterium]
MNRNSKSIVNSVEEIREHIKRVGIIPIIRGDFPTAWLLELGDVLLAAGIPVVEVTLNSQNALGAIATLRERFGDDMVVGVGTVRTVEQVDPAIDVGAQFVVSPNFDPASVARSQARGILHLPGVLTPTEAQTAYAAGCSMLKLFPADVLGPDYLKALRAPLDDIEFVPTGGISPTNLSEYVRAGAVAVGVGSSLVPGSPIALEEIEQRAKALREIWERARRG